MEEKLARTFLEILRIDQDEGAPLSQYISTDDSFFEMGGDSLSAIQLLAHLQEDHPSSATSLTIVDVFNNPSPRGLAGVLSSYRKEGDEDGIGGGGDAESSTPLPSKTVEQQQLQQHQILCLATNRTTSTSDSISVRNSNNNNNNNSSNKDGEIVAAEPYYSHPYHEQGGGGGGRSSLFLLPGAGASALCFRPLVAHLQTDLYDSIFAMDDNSLNGSVPFMVDSIEEVAEIYISEILKRLNEEEEMRHLSSSSSSSSSSSLSPPPPLVLGGWSYGGVIALEAARQLQQSHPGLSVTNVLLFDAPIKLEGGSREEEPLEDLDTVVAKMMLRMPDLKASPDVARLAASHFIRCTELLHEYYCPSDFVLNDETRVLSVRPHVGTVALSSEDELASSLIASPSSLSSSSPSSSAPPSSVAAGSSSSSVCDGQRWVTKYTPGDHWTMLFETNVHPVAAAVSQFLSKNEKDGNGGWRSSAMMNDEQDEIEGKNDSDDQSSSNMCSQSTFSNR
eukprot:jgi/Bigna1/136629/aug1.35_g11337